MSDVGDVEDDQARFSVGEIDERAFDVRRTVQRDLALRLLTARHVLPRHPPAAGFDGLRRIADIDDHVDVAAVAGHARREMHVAPARIKIAMRAGAAGLVLAEALRPRRIGEAPDEDALVVGLRGVSAPSLPDFFERRVHLVAADLHLDRPGVRRAGNEIRDGGLCGVGHVEDRPAAMPQVARVEIPAAVSLLDGKLEGRPAVHLAVADHADIARDRSWRDLSEDAPDEQVADEARGGEESERYTTHSISFRCESFARLTGFRMARGAQLGDE